VRGTESSSKGGTERGERGKEGETVEGKVDQSTKRVLDVSSVRGLEVIKGLLDVHSLSFRCRFSGGRKEKVEG